MSFLSAIRPNIIVLAAIGAVLAAYSGSEQIVAALVGGIVTTMFLLGGPPPNPKISKDIVMTLIEATGAQAPRVHGSNRDGLVIALIIIASVVTLILGINGVLAGNGLENVIAGLVAATVTLAGKMVDPGDDETGTQAVAMELIAILKAKSDD